VILSDTDWVALTLWAEARAEPIEGQIGVANVIRNRVKSGRWGRTYESVCLAPKQFSCWIPEGGKANYDALQVLKRSVELGGDIKDRALRTCYWVASGCVDGSMPENVSGACHYHAITMASLPKWAVGHVPVARLGHHAFYAGIA